MKTVVRLWIAFALLALFASIARADFTGRVVRVHDGDTLTVLVDRRQVRVRLTDIDAPERGQAYGKRAREKLAALTFAHVVRVADRGTDRYGRVLGRVYVDGVDVNARMVDEGLAWVYRQYSRDAVLIELEAMARRELRGLWADAHAVPPWEWRRNKER